MQVINLKLNILSSNVLFSAARGPLNQDHIHGVRTESQNNNQNQQMAFCSGLLRFEGDLNISCHRVLIAGEGDITWQCKNAFCKTKLLVTLWFFAEGAAERTHTHLVLLQMAHVFHISSCSGVQGIFFLPFPLQGCAESAWLVRCWPEQSLVCKIPVSGQRFSTLKTNRLSKCFVWSWSSRNCLEL